MTPDPTLSYFSAIAAPLDEWCQFCEMKLATAKTADDVWACDDCQKAVLEALAKYEADAAFSVAAPPRPKSAKSAKAKAKRRAKRKRTGR